MNNWTIEITEEKLRKLKPIFESILSRTHGKTIKITSLTMGGITIKDEELKEGK
ncbi:Uncharacterized protein BWINRASL_04480 [Bacillus mycoides]|uniref:hypothetical protein n=1 Tax=Bacillus wiedmannii TaxID=1890302 RepID=UPI000278CECA|nr:hypothetical protein IEQ_04000 [Bacillus cereus BAG6X1-2]SCM97861.1 Uncharacterized protein BWINRASL_04480 [Bacillus mycoides]